MLQNKSVEITEITVMELKALAFDQIQLRDQCQANLNAINVEIMRRNGLTKEVKKEKEAHICAEHSDKKK